MSIGTWIGGSASIAQVWAGTITAVANTNTFTLTFTDEVGGTVAFIVTAGGGDTPTTMALALATAINASTDPRISGVVTAVPLVGKVTITASSAGVPFYVAATTSGGTWGTTGNTTPNNGPNDLNTAANWAEYIVPATSANITLTGNSAIKYGLVTGWTGGLLAASGFSGTVGQAGRYLQATPTSFNWNGTGIAYVNLLTAAIAPRISKSANASIGQSGLYLLGSAMTTMLIESGSTSVELANSPGQTSTVATVTLNGQGARVLLGAGASVTTLRNILGASDIRCALTTLEADGGNVTTSGAGAIGTVIVNGGSHIFNSSGTITTFNKKGGISDFTQSDTARTITTLTDFGLGELSLDSTVITLTNQITPSGRMSVTTANLNTAN